jgi:uncharacterized protein
MIAALWSLGAGLMFALGLTLSGMTQPAKVLGFLDVAGKWDPSLGLVMAGAVTVYAIVGRGLRAGRAPWLGGLTPAPPSRRIDGWLVAGAAIFGVGWGLGGFCPGPAVVSLGARAVAAWWLVPAMLVGMVMHDALLGSRHDPDE